MTEKDDVWSEVEVHSTSGLMCAKVSAIDLPRVTSLRWSVSWMDDRPYAVAYTDGRTILMHRLIMEAPKGVVVDHRNHETLDNRRQNLRIATQQQNAWNVRRHRDSASPYKGVYKKGRRLWAKIQNRLIGSYPSAEHAALAYNDAARVRFGPFASLNPIPPEIEAELRWTSDQGRRPKRSQFKGVSFVPGMRDRPWRATKRVAGRDYRLGMFRSPLEAALAVDSLCLELGLGNEHMNFPSWPAMSARERTRAGATGRILRWRRPPSGLSVKEAEMLMPAT